MRSTSKRVFLAVLIVGLVFAVGCGKKEEPAPAPAPNDVSASAAAADATTTALDSATTSIEQTKCPVMDAPINKELFTEYEGKKVYFCCAGCKEKFEAEPAKYLAKLPQFKK